MTKELLDEKSEISPAVIRCLHDTSLLGITLEDKDKTYNLNIGETFPLNLDRDLYDWTVTVDHENVLQLKTDVIVIQGAQGLYEALGTAILSATGDPKCRQANPPCGAPSILFMITMTVQ